jgi:DHA1 family tetracycline resistance protein-like MFS transporter
LGLNASGNAIIFVYVGIIVVAVQGGLIGRWSRRFGDRRLIYAGLALLAVGLLAIGLTVRQPPPWYSQAEVAEELTADPDLPGETPPTKDIAVDLPDDSNNGWLGLIWILIAMIPIAVGGGILQPAINSLITKRVDIVDVGGMLGISAAFLSAANAIAPIIGGALFQAIGPGAPFVFWSLLLALLLAVAVRTIRPGREEATPAGLARGGSH